jgi:DNA polymerase/3'-5' exonuclease PolX
MSERGRRNQLGELTLPIQNAEVAAMFDQVAELLEIEGQNQFRVRAYRRAARVIEPAAKRQRYA